MADTRKAGSSCMKYAPVLILLFTQKLAFALVGNSTQERIVLAKVLSGRLEIPWFNINNFRGLNEVRSHCRDDVAKLLESADAGEMWALKMLDAASKIPSGILRGNIYDLGTYDECVGVKGYHNSARIGGQHCMISLWIPLKSVDDAAALLSPQKYSILKPKAYVDFSLTLSVCLPSTCNVDDVEKFANASIQSTPELAESEVNVARVICSSLDYAVDVTTGAVLTICLLAVIISLLLFCTGCELMANKISPDSHPALMKFAKFSLYRNAKKLLSTKIPPESMPALNGLRFLSTMLVVLGHRVLLVIFKPLVNLTDIYELRSSVIAIMASSLPHAVDTFFILASFLTTHSILKTLRSRRKFNILMVYLHRYVRLVPCLVVMILLIAYMQPYFGSGPLWEAVVAKVSNFCKKNWWTNLLFINNYVNAEEMCLPHTWSLAVEMQLFWLSPMIIYPLHRKPNLGLILLGLFLIMSLIVPGIQIATNQYAALIDFSNTNFELAIYEWIIVYMSTHNRALPYFMGILLGYEVLNNKRRITKGRASFTWILTCVSLILCSLANYHVQPHAPTYNVIWEVAHATVLHLVSCTAIAWIIYACTQGYGGPLTELLSMPVFVPLSRLCYCIYLIHPVIQLWMSGITQVASFFSPYIEIYQATSDMVVSVVLASVFTLSIETPMIVLIKFITVEKSSENDPTTKINRFDSTRNEIRSDPVNEEELLRIMSVGRDLETIEI